MEAAKGPRLPIPWSGASFDAPLPCICGGQPPPLFALDRTSANILNCIYIKICKGKAVTNSVQVSAGESRTVLLKGGFNGLGCGRWCCGRDSGVEVGVKGCCVKGWLWWHLPWVHGWWCCCRWRWGGGGGGLLVCCCRDQSFQGCQVCAVRG